MTKLPTSFKQLMTARFLFTLGTQIQTVILGWRMYSLTHDPLYLGLVGLSEAVPAIGFALLAGYVVDRGRPLNIFRHVLELSLLSAVVMLLSQLPSLGFTDQEQIIALFLSSFLTGMARAFTGPSIFALVPRIIDRQNLAHASASMTSSLQVARISGPALGGILFGLIGMVNTSWVVTIVLIVSVLSTYIIKIHFTHAPPPKRDHIVRELTSGLSFVLKHPILFPALALDMVSVLFGGVTALLPIYAAEVLMIGPIGLGWLRASPAIGAALMSFTMAHINFRQNAGRWFLNAVAGFGLCILVFALSRHYALSLIALALSGAFDSISMVIRTAIVQLSSPDSMRGRISAVNSIFISSSNELGEFESGVAAKLLGTIGAATFGGIVCVVTVAVVALISPKIRGLNLDQLKNDA